MLLGEGNAKVAYVDISLKKIMTKKRVIVAMSGGVDSSVAAALLKDKGYEVIGATMCIGVRGGAERGAIRCCGPSDVEDARRVALQLGISFFVFTLQEEFEREVIDYFCEEYQKGRTPNPCVLCNQKIKFGSFLEKAKQFDADFISTGHYARVEFDEETHCYLLKKGVDQKKDQSYVLFSLSQRQFQQTLLPLGTHRKEEVRKKAFDLGLQVHDKPESQEVCFIQDSSYHSFLSERLNEPIVSGPIIDKEGNVVGTHKGIPFYTVGQRRGLHLAKGKPLYVIRIEKEKNTIVVGEENEVFGDIFVVNSLNWIQARRTDSPFSAQVKIRYNHPGSEAILSWIGKDEIEVTFKTPQKAITPGQAAVFYEDETVLGGGWIKTVLKS